MRSKFSVRNARNPVLGQFGTFDVENYGDLLYPVLFKKMLEQRRKNGDVAKFSIRGSNSLQDSGYRTRPVRDLFSRRGERPGTLVVGGGDLLHIQWDTVVSYYRSLCREEGEDLRPGRWRRRWLRLVNKPRDEDTEFRRRYLNYPAVGPFMIKPNRLIKSVAYCSCGVPSPFDEIVGREVANTFDRASFIYVRDNQSKENLTRAGVEKEIHVAPDLIVALSDFFDGAVEREKGRKLLREGGINTDRPILIFQCHVQAPEFADKIVEQLKAHQARNDCEVVLVPLGGCHGDREFLKDLAQRSAGAFKYVELRSIFDIISVLAACDVFAGTSMHGNITAFSFGIPHVFGPLNLTKREGFLEIAGLPQDVKLETWEELNAALELALNRGSGFFQNRLDTAKQRVNEVFDKLCRAINAEERH
ncbi:MAG TPA: polysaccharide pyruvyl transferase family protein [Verrucomicrobiae bacterium]|nr:polysaccharide pyruvyl transferase family protein [Verrucomicrobiae bacterium]